MIEKIGGAVPQVYPTHKNTKACTERGVALPKI